LETVDHFARSLFAAYGAVYLRVPTNEDVRRILATSLQRGWPGKLGSIDCMSLWWKNCPYGLQGAHKGRKGKPTLTLEAVVDADLWFWHLYFGVPGSANDINVMQSSPFLNNVLRGIFLPPIEYSIGDTRVRRPYFLADGIYPKSPLFVQSYTVPDNRKKAAFNAAQEAERKEVERAFGVLQSKFRFFSTANSVEIWDKNRIISIVTAAVILHNMAVEDRREERQGGEVNEESIEEGVTGTLVGTEEGAMFEWQHAVVGAEGQAPPPGSFAGMCLANSDFQNDLEWHNLRARLADFIFETTNQ
jgi:Plant transposon protein